MRYSIIVDKGADKYGHQDYRPLFTEHFQGKHFLYVKRERPQLMKRLIRTVKRTKGQITGIQSVYDAKGKWVKIIYVR